ncbi:MAG: hypothetical protein HAW59_02235 [Betaproteobacteria bacterium]|nr:hypothetical protein [Betaproteobacteria bacterium]
MVFGRGKTAVKIKRAFFAPVFYPRRGGQSGNIGKLHIAKIEKKGRINRRVVFAFGGIN